MRSRNSCSRVPYRTGGFLPSPELRRFFFPPSGARPEASNPPARLSTTIGVGTLGGGGDTRVVTYWCRHCGTEIGQYAVPWDDPRLGLSRLTEAERADIIEADLEADRVRVRVLCERCLPVPVADEWLWYN